MSRTLDLWLPTALCILVGSSLLGLFVWLLVSLRPITARDCIPRAHPVVVLEQCAKVQP